MSDNLHEPTVFNEYPEEYVRSLIHSSLDMIISVDLKHKIVEFNKAAEKTFGYKKEEVVGKNIDILYASPEKAKTIHAFLEGKDQFSGEVQNKRKNGEVFQSFASVSAIRDEHGNTLGIMGISRDITHQKNVENELRMAMQKIETAGKAKDEFLANMSHEIRTPLNGIIGISDIILDGTLDDNQLSLMQTLNIEAASLLNIINDILDFSKIEAGKLELEEISFNLRSTINAVNDSFQYRAHQKGLEFNCFMPSDFPSLLIGDPTRLRQVLVNLVNNSMKFTAKGEILINVEMAEDLGERVKLSFTIKDTGVGIPKDKQTQIFQKFVQADSSTSKKYGGTGLGVPICKEFVELMGGELHLESEEGKGSTFEFTSFFTKQKEQGTIETGEKPDLADKKVLLVDDRQAERHVLSECLKSFGCSTVEASGSKEALEILREAVSSGKFFDLVLINFNMPQLSSVNLVNEIKDVYLLKEVPSIMLTDVGKIGDAKVCSDIGIDGYLSKPIRKDYLQKAIESVLTVEAKGEDSTNRQLVTRHTIAEEMSKNDIRILLVEDYPTNQVVAMRYLQHAGYKVDLAESGKQAVEAYEKKHHDLVFMDLQLPEMDGFEATKRIRVHEAEFTKNKPQSPTEVDGPAEAIRIPIIAMTAHATTEIRDKCLSGGMDDFISKPVRRNDLLAMTEKWCSKIVGSRQSTASIETTVSKKAVTHTNAPTKPDVVAKASDPMDLESGIKEFEGDREFFIEVAEGFLEKVREQIKTIEQALSARNPEIVKKESHSIKGGSATLTALNLSQIADRLEKIGKSGNLKDGAKVFEELQKEFHRVEDFVNKLNK